MRYAILALAVVGLFVLAGCQHAAPTAPAQNTGSQGAPSPSAGQPAQATNPGITVANTTNDSLGVNVNPSSYTY